MQDAYKGLVLLMIIISSIIHNNNSSNIHICGTFDCLF